MTGRAAAVKAAFLKALGWTACGVPEHAFEAAAEAALAWKEPSEGQKLRVMWCKLVGASDVIGGGEEEWQKLAEYAIGLGVEREREAILEVLRSLPVPPMDSGGSAADGVTLAIQAIKARQETAGTP